MTPYTQGQIYFKNESFQQYNINYNNFSYHLIPIYLITLVILEYQLIENIH